MTDKNVLTKVFSCEISGTTPFKKECESLIYGQLDPVKRQEYECKGGPEAKALDTQYDKCVEDKEKASGTTTTEEPVGNKTIHEIKQDALKKSTDMSDSVHDCVKNALFSPNKFLRIYVTTNKSYSEKCLSEYKLIRRLKC